MEGGYHCYLSGKELKQMAKSIEKVVIAFNYYEELNLVSLDAWKDSISFLIWIHKITEGPAQI